ncbi:MAG: hypothetical protein CR967_03885 [Proteobacteria bacterium]|nr:MAG: hypothetical protein CR967_03885 [Pseudomonadota bacterium]
MTNKYANIFISLIFIVLGVLLYKSTLDLKASSIVTTGFYIKFLAISLIASACFELLKSFIANQKEKIIFAKDLKGFVYLIFFLIFYVWSMEYLGFVLSSLIFLSLTMWFMGYKKPLGIFVISILVIVFVQGLFVYVFEIPLPESSIFGELEWF